MSITRGLAVALAFGLVASASAQEPWPTKPIRIVVPFVAAGPVDGSARAVAAKLQEAFGQPVVVENIAGSGGGVGSLRVARAPADGYTFLMVTLGTHAILPHVNPGVGFDPVKDFTPVAELGSFATILVVNSDEPYKELGDLLKAARQSPGKINYGSSGTGATAHLSAELMASMAGVSFTHIPYKGNAPAMVDLLAGRITFMFDVLLNSAPQIQAGKIRALGVSNATGVAQLPHVPPISKTLPGYEVSGWIGLVGPPGVPRHIVDKMNVEVEKITRMPDFVAKYASYGFEARSSSATDFGRRIRKDFELWGPVVKAAGIKAD